MTTPRRIAVKILTRQPDAEADLSLVIPLFHRFIQQKSVDGLLVDVADYHHVPNGPGVILVGHDVDYGIDRVGGKTGLLTIRKRLEGQGVEAALRDTLAKAFGCARAIEADGSAGLSFAPDALHIEFWDRLETPNDDAGFAKVKGAVESVLGDAYGGASLTLSRGDGDARVALTVVVQAEGAVDLDALCERLGAGVAAAPAALSSSVPDEQRQSQWDIAVEDLKRMRDGGESHFLLDVREVREFEICHLDGELIPLGTLGDRMGEVPKDRPVVVHCHLGGRSAAAVNALREAGFENVWNLNGGIRAWIQRIDSSLQDY